jgi:hypothetical protein
MILCDAKLWGAQQDAPRHFVSGGHVCLVIYLVSYTTYRFKGHNSAILLCGDIDRSHTDVDLLCIRTCTRSDSFAALLIPLALFFAGIVELFVVGHPTAHSGCCSAATTLRGGSGTASRGAALWKDDWWHCISWPIDADGGRSKALS